MPAFETMDLNQRAVLWSKNGSDLYNVATVDAPVDVRCRWVWKRRELRDAKGDTIVLDAQVTLSRTVGIGSILWQGSLCELAGTGTSETPDSDIMLVVTQSQTPDIKGRNTRWDYGLARYTDQLPAVTG